MAKKANPKTANRCFMAAAYLVLVGMLVAATQGASAATLTVCSSGCDYSDLSGAILAASSGDTLELGAERFEGAFVIDRALTLTGQGNEATVLDGNGLGTTLTVQASATSVILQDLQVTGGLVDGNGGGIVNDANLFAQGVWVRDNTASDGGGGIFNTGVLSLDGSYVTDNTGMTDGTGGIGGAGIASNGSGASLIIDGSTIARNSLTRPGTEDRGGGGISIKQGSLVLRDSVVSDNESGYAAGGIYAAGSGATVVLERTTVINNRTGIDPDRDTGRGGGLFLDNAVQARIDDSSILDNVSKSSGGGIYSDVGLTLSNSTLSGNQATGTGGGISSDSNLFLDSVTLANNVADFGGGLFVTNSRTAFLTNTLIADNVASDSADDCYAAVSSASGQVSLIESVDGFCRLNGDGVVLSSQDPMLGPLADNGGPTLTHLPATNSPAVDAGSTELVADQRGVPRPLGDADDIGAVEVDAVRPEPAADIWFLTLDPTLVANETVAAPADVTAYRTSSGFLSVIARLTADGVQVDGFQRIDEDGWYFSVDTHTLIDGLAIAPADIVESDNGDLQKIFDARAAGVPDGVNLDALAVNESGRLIFSVDTHVDLNGTAFSDADLIEYDGENFVLFRSADSMGFSASDDIDALTLLDQGEIVVSVGHSSAIGSVVFDAGSLLVFDGTTVSNVNWRSTEALGAYADVVALDGETLAELIFSNSFEAP
jgi:nitrous oxidase accessory protein NosD